jgi:transcriptional regulator of met regulon
MPEGEKHADQGQVANSKIECEAHIEAEAILGFQRVRDFKDERDDEISKPAIDILKRPY